MDGAQNQNDQKGGEKKAQLSWSQPATTAQAGKPQQNKEPQKQPASGTGAAQTKMSPMTRNILIVVGIIIIIGIVWALVASSRHVSPAPAEGGTAATTTTSTPSGAGTPAGTSSTTSSMTDGSLSIPTPQGAGLQVAVSNVSVSAPTWVVVYEDYNGQPGNVLGAALFTPTRTSGVVDLLRGTLPGQTYFAGEARDDGDHMFSMQNDPAMRDASGNPALVQFQTR